ncbi:DNA cytosine methyltransferase [Amycolatopsis carbonis]|uniref:DNA cytosine methyltransferase n=1 Tax=Amycolatopsis carbonis TaxID=715471 RepID=A0A9Y2IKS7_9PSEU|nr:DNA cytosine methyltransferase [Amycolatopsis sp. 2-15]WIX80841.1 DNA cytosine methyltransferase [Amycolatopsis sp. 2-15]
MEDHGRGARLVGAVQSRVQLRDRRRSEVAGERLSTQPAFTVTGKVSRNRLVGRGKGLPERFTDHEAGKLQTFPYDYPWSGRGVAQQIGNAIPPRLAAHVLAAALDKDLDDAVLDWCVKQSWKETRKGVEGLAKDRAKASSAGRGLW